MTDGKSDDSRPLDDFEEWKRLSEAGEVSARDTYKKISNIAVLLGYDLIDKLRFLEKDTLELPDERIPERVEHVVRFLDRFRDAYLDFSDVDP